MVTTPDQVWGRSSYVPNPNLRTGTAFGGQVTFPYAYDGVYQRLVRKYFRLAGIEDAGIHILRKTAGALLIQAGVDIYRVSKFLGHSSVGVTERHYVDLLSNDYEDMSKVLEKIIG